MSDKSKFSSESEPLDGPPSNPAVFPIVMLGTAAVLGGAFFFGQMEANLASLFSSPLKAKSCFTALGAISITAAHGHAMVYNGNARKTFNVPHPTESDDVAYLNAGRGYYNFVEHFPFFLFNFLFARESSPCLAGLAAFAFGIGRVLYTEGYAWKGPKGRVTGFMLSTFSSMTCLGLGIFAAIFSS